MAGRNIKITDQGAVIFSEDEAGAKTVSLKAPSDVTENYATSLPATTVSGTNLINATRSGSEPYDVTLSFQPAANVGMAGVNVLNHSVTGTAVADATGDDTANIKAAVDVAETAGANSLSERLVFPAGGYRLKELGKVDTHTCFQADKNYWFEGAGMGMTNMFLAMVDGSTSGDYSMIECTAVQPRFFALTDMTFDGNAGGTDSEDLAAINITADYIVIDNVEFKNFVDPILRITGSPKFVSITNCRFTDLAENTGESRQAMVCLDGVASSECTFIFDGNHMVANPYAASVDGDSLNGVNVVPSAVSKKIRCLIKNNYFSKLGNPAVSPGAAVTLEPGCHDSVISNNIFDNCVHSSIHVESCNNIEISNNTLASEDSEMAAGADVVGIYVDSDAASSSNLRITGNSITGTVKTDIGIRILGDAETSNSINGVIIADNVIDGCKNALSIDRVEGRVGIIRNSIKNDSAALAAFVGTRHAVYINDLAGAAKVDIIGNSFTGGSSSGGAIHFDRSIGTHTNSEGHVVLKDNFFDRMGQHADWSNGSAVGDDLALVYIRGKDTTDYIKTFDASGNRYDFTDALTGTYGMSVLNVSETCTFDSILEFGAVGDGATDCTVAIDRASVAAGDGGEINIPRGTFLVSDLGDAREASTSATVSPTNTCIQPAQDNQIWTGAGTITVAAGSNDVVLEIGTAITGTIVRGLTFLGDATNTGRAIRMVALSSGNHGTVDACKISLFGTGVSAYGPGSKVINCNIESCKTFGVEGGIDSNGDELTISNNNITFGVGSATGIGIYVKGKDIHITGNTISNAAVNSISLGANSETIVVQGNTINTGTATGGSATYNPVRVYKSKDISIQGNNITGTGAHTLTRHDIYLASDSGSADTDVCHKCTISGNTVTSKNVKIAGDGNCYAITITNNTLVTTQDPSAIPDSKGNNLNGIDFENYGGTPSGNIADSVISGNVIIGEAAYAGGSPARNCAINLGTGDRNVVMGNTIKNWNIGIHILAGGDNNHLVGNNLASGVTTNVVNGGASNVDLVTSESGVLETITRASVGDLRGGIFRIGPQGGSLYSAARTLDETKITEISATAHTATSGNATIDIDSSVHMVEAAATENTLCVIKIDGKHTRVAAYGGNDEQAAATLPYDGMVLCLIVVGTERLRCDVVPVGTGDSQTQVGAWGHNVTDNVGNGMNIILQADDGQSVGDFDPGQAPLFRFEHDGTEGVWRYLGSHITGQG